jgi:hypothetical protein
MPTQAVNVAASSPAELPVLRVRAPGRRVPWLGAASRLARAVHYLRAALLDERGSQITDNLGLIVIGIAAIVAIGGLVTGLDTTVFNWVTRQLGIG